MTKWHGWQELDAQVIKAYSPGFENFEDYMNSETKDKFLEYKPAKKYTDASLKNIAEKGIKIKVLLQMPIEERNKIIKDIYRHTGVNIRQLARVLGTGKAMVEKAIK